MYVGDITSELKTNANGSKRLPEPPNSKGPKNKTSPYKNQYPKSTPQLSNSSVRDVTNSNTNSSYPNSMNSSPRKVLSPDYNYQRGMSPSFIGNNKISQSPYNQMSNTQRTSYYRDYNQDFNDYRPESNYGNHYYVKNQYTSPPNNMDYIHYDGHNRMSNYSHNIQYEQTMHFNNAYNIPPGKYSSRRSSQCSTPNKADFVELNNLPNHVRAAGQKEDLELMSNKFSSNSNQSLNEYKPFIANNSEEYGGFDPRPPAHVLRPESQFYDQRLVTRANLPNHVNATNLKHQDNQFASPSTTFDPASHRVPSHAKTPIKEKRRSCFGLCGCSGKMCVIVTTAACFFIGLILFFLWVRIPGISPSSEFRIISGPTTTVNETISTFKAQLQIELRINNPNFYPLWLNELNGKVYDIGTNNQIGNGNVKPLYVPIQGEAFTNYTIDINYYTSSQQDRTFLDIMAACPHEDQTTTRYPLGLSTIVEAKFNLFTWANIIPKDSFNRNIVCQ
ncbi:hypothetical protein K502DRAFT_342981 [Neoconidiobolus thromboides FSU 785]|nr:hypothetical protein K502DRAFT_342981 [Neoconidiobolus thromboides FSU 785]